jgi:hypothetical protein
MKILKELFAYLVVLGFIVLVSIGITGHVFTKAHKDGFEQLNVAEKLFYQVGHFFSFGFNNSDQLTLDPTKLAKARELIFDLPELQTKNWADFENKLNLDQKILISILDVSNSTWKAYLLSLDQKDTLHTWSIDQAFITEHTNTKDLHRSRIKHPYMLPDTSLVFEMHKEENLYCLDKNSNLKWKTKVNAHHSLNPDSHGNIWFCAGKDTTLPENFWDEYLVQANTDGEILQKISIYSLLKNNGFYDLIASSAVNEQNVFHLNDIQPSLSATKYWNQGDLFISLRNLNMVLLYRPENDSILWHSFGPWHSQHDVDIVSDSTILVFNNNRVSKKQQKIHTSVFDTKSNIVRYDFSNGQFEVLLTNYANEHDFYTDIEGSQELLNDSILIIEETMKGRYHLVNLNDPNEFETFSFTQFLDNQRYYPRMNWFRVY